MMKRAVVAILLLPGAVAASTAGEATAGFPAAGVRLLVALGLVVGLIFLFVALSRRGMKLFPAGRAGRIKVLEMRGLGARKSLCLVEVRGEEMLLGVSGDRIELISSWRGESHGDTPFEKAVQERIEELK